MTCETSSDADALRIESVLGETIGHHASGGCPPRLASALRYAVFPGGRRIRPRLVLSIARACLGEAPRAADAVGAAIELLHCASLVHDDMPCFDDAATRRGRPSVQRAYGQAAALLVGDALIVAAFDASASVPRFTRILADAAGAARGLVGGQAWELETCAPWATYHRAKTTALFEAATVGAALAAEVDAEAWRPLGIAIGQAYQIADDIEDATGDSARMGKPAGQDETRDRPSAVRSLGLHAACLALERTLAGAIDAVPPCRGDAALRVWVRQATSAMFTLARDRAA